MCEAIAFVIGIGESLSRRARETEPDSGEGRYTKPIRKEYTMRHKGRGKGKRGHKRGSKRSK